MQELKPCPFCGGEADVHYFAHDDSECTVMCSNPNCRASVSAKSCGSMTTAYNRARKLWNRRSERTCHIVPMDAAGNPPYRTGDWILNELSDGCSECGYPFDTPNRGIPHYCLRCGARVVE